MVEPLHPDTEAKIAALCKKIAISHDLDEEIQEELRGHMDDKLRAYLSGEEPVTEADAMLLVREHFGDPATLKGLLQGVHHVEARAGYLRRLAAIGLAYLAFANVTSLFLSICWMFTLWLKARGISENTEYVLLPPIIAAILLGNTFAYWRVLLHWRRMEMSGAKLWYVSWRPRAIATLLLLFFLATILVPASTLPEQSLNMGMVSSLFANVLVVSAVLAAIVLHALIWLWWCDRSPRTPHTLMYSAATWFVMLLIPWSAVSLLAYQVNIYDPMSATSLINPIVTLWQEQNHGYTYTWSLVTTWPEWIRQAQVPYAMPDKIVVDMAGDGSARMSIAPSVWLGIAVYVLLFFFSLTIYRRKFKAVTYD